MRLARSFATNLWLRLLQRNEYESERLRRYFRNAYKIDIGLYSYGCFDPWRIPRGTTIGRYCSFARSARILDENHPIQSLSTHPYLYERRFGLISDDRIGMQSIVVEDDVWFGHAAITTPRCKKVGRGAVIGAGAVVTRDVPRYAIMAGNPAKVLRYRFEPQTIERLEASRWWTLSKVELAEYVSASPGLLCAPGRDSLEAMIESSPQAR